jgi:hypothetical protein
MGVMTALRLQRQSFMSNATDREREIERALIPKLADPDSSCVRPTGRSIAKTYSGPMGYGRRVQARTVAQVSQCLRGLVLELRPVTLRADRWIVVIFKRGFGFRVEPVGSKK